MAAEKRSNNLIIVLGLVTAVVGAGLVLLLLGRGDNGSTKASQGSSGDTVPVLVSKRSIPQGSVGADLGDSVEVKQVPAVTRSSDALVSLGELADRTTTVDIGVDQQLRSVFFRQRTARGGAIKIPDGMQAVALAIPFTNAGGGYVGPGDRVNIHALVAEQNGSVIPTCGSGLCGGDPRGPQATAQLVLPNVQVLDVSQEVAPATVTNAQPAAEGALPRGDGAQATLTYLLALDASRAEKAIFFARYGEVYLTLVPKGQPDAATGGRDQTNVLKP